LSGNPITDAGLVHLANLPLFEVLNVELINTGRNGLASLATLTSLKELSVRTTSDEEIELWSFPNQKERARLKQLDKPPLCYADLAPLARLVSLERLDMESQPVGDEALACLSQFHTLKTLFLRNTKISDAGLAHLSKLSSLKSLIIGNSELPAEGRNRIPSRERLMNCSNQITDAGLAHLQSLENLIQLNLDNTGVTDEGLAKLRDLPIDWISVKGTKATEAGLAHLSNAYRADRYDGGGVGVPRISRYSDDIWDYYVRHFIQTHRLDAGQQATANSALRELKAQAAQYRQARKSEYAELNTQLKQVLETVAQANPESRGKARQVVLEYNQRRDRLEKPIMVDLYGQLKQRLDSIPSGGQKR
jgi:hypothetical protein